MVKQTVCENANEALSTYNEALATNNALQVKNETAKKQVANVSFSSALVFLGGITICMLNDIFGL